MLKSLLIMLAILIVTPAYAGINYYYFTSDSCSNCKIINPAIRDLQEKGFDFQIIKDGTKLPVRSYPTVVIEISGFKSLLAIEELLNNLKKGNK